MFEKQKFKFSGDAAHLRSVNPRIYIGGALDPNVLQSENSYRTLAAEELNCLTSDMAMKWKSVEKNRGQLTYSGSDQLLAFA
jgi:GH35 family endo-1,4-beta-xylanase